MNVQILLVEDSQTQAKKMEHFFRQNNYDIRVETNGVKALEWLERNTPTLILSDIKMPEMDGYELCRVVKSDKRWLTIPFVLLTGLSDPEDVLNGLSSGADGFIYKALSLEDLLTTVNHWVERGRSLHVSSAPQKFRFNYGQHTYDVPADHKVILNFLVNTYQMAIRHNKELIKARNELDQTNRQLSKARSVAEEADKAKSDFLANMSHEIRTPMNAILGMAHLISKTELTPKQLDYLKKIDDSAKILLRIINDVLDFSKIEAGRMAIESVPFHLEDVLRIITSLLGPKASEKKLELLFRVDRDVPTGLIGDPLRLGQVLINLVGNAVKFTREGEIVISIKVGSISPEEVVLSFAVSDTGIGLTQEEIDGLFQPFSQADTSTTRKYGGTGLGLAICKQLTALMGGEIKVASDFGKGSVFSFTVKLGMHNQVRVIPKRMLDEFKDMRVLVVDDNASAQEVLKEALETFSFDVDIASSGKEALEMIAEAKEKRYELVLMDWKMPDMDGLTTAKRIQAESAFTCPPKIILITAYGREEIMEQAKFVKVDGFLIKPVSRSVLWNTIMDVMGKVEGKEEERSPGRQQLNGSTLFQGKRVLVAEDNEINMEVAREILGEVGLQVIGVTTGEEAVKIVDEEEFDAVFMDIQMPVMDGLEAARRIRKNERHSELPIIAMTAHAMSGDKEKSLSAGMNDHVTKPIDPDQLLQTLARWLNKGEGREDMEEETFLKLNDAEEKDGEGEGGELPVEIPGLDVEDGLARIGGNMDLYLRLLVKLRDSHSDTVVKIRAELDKGERENARRLAHTLKGVAGNLGAGVVKDTAQTLETALLEEKVEELPELIDALESVLDELVLGLGELNVPDEEAVETHKASKEELVSVLKDLTPGVKAHRPKECTLYLERVNSLQWPEELTESVEELKTMIKKYKFKPAQAVLEELLGKIDK